ncbi:MAG: DUF1801 domain-containing protein [Bacillota bacterium]|nr:DUF1801 domain-containing protein [Bacillota bacterium]
MKIEAKSINEYIEKLPEERKKAVEKLRDIANKSLPKEIKEELSYGMIGYVVPHKIYPKGYHVSPKKPLPLVSIASQKRHIALYHMGIYMFPEVLEWFKEEYSKRVDTKLDMGKSCIRFKNPDKIPYDLLEELFRKITVEEYIKKYEVIIS